MMIPILVCLVAADWWTSYGDPQMNRLVERALANNNDLKLAASRIAEARALRGTAKSRLGPQINATASTQRLRGGFSQGVVRAGGGNFVSPFETGILQGGLDMRWELDLFGSNRALVAASQADLEAEVQRREDVAITVSAETARYYMEVRGAEDRLTIARRNVATQQELLDLTVERVRAGLSSELDAERQRTLLANTEASLPALEAERTLALNRLAVLVADETFVQSVLPAIEKPLVAPTLSAELPSELLKRRPDVRAAEARWAAAQARLKQARTDLYPKINLLGGMGRQSTSISGFTLGGGNFFNFGPQVQVPLFNSGRIRSNIAASDARVEQEKITYQNEILLAFEEAANAIASMQRQREREAKLAIALRSAQTSLALSEDLHRAGMNDFLSVLDAQRGVLDADFERSIARTQVLVQSVALYKALAGGWPN